MAITKRPYNCTKCSERVRTGESGFTLNGRRICRFCAESVITDEERSDNPERQAEDYAAYRINGNTADYWTDRDAGLAY